MYIKLHEKRDKNVNKLSKWSKDVEVETQEFEINNNRRRFNKDRTNTYMKENIYNCVRKTDTYS